MPEHIKLYRIQDDDGRGPFRPGFSHQWCDDNFADGMNNLPSWIEEFGHDAIDRLAQETDFHFGTGVRRPRDLNRWFSTAERVRLKELGFRAVSLSGCRRLAESHNQVLFGRFAPLFVGASIVRWDSIPELVATS